MNAVQVEEFLLHLEKNKVVLYGDESDEALKRILDCAVSCNWRPADPEEPFLGIVHHSTCYMKFVRENAYPN